MKMSKIFFALFYYISIINSPANAFRSSGIYASDYDTLTTRLVKRLPVIRKHDPASSSTISLLKKVLQLSSHSHSLFLDNGENNATTAAATLFMVESAERHLLPENKVVLAVPSIVSSDHCGENRGTLFSYRIADRNFEDNIEEALLQFYFQNGQDLVGSCNDVPMHFQQSTWRNEWMQTTIPEECFVADSKDSSVKLQVCLKTSLGNFLKPDQQQPVDRRSFLVVRFKEPSKFEDFVDATSEEVSFAPVLPFADSPKARGLRFAQRLFKREAAFPPSRSRYLGDICHLETLHINFRENDLNLGILYPASYSANYCSGQCGFPTPRHLTATRHAQWQAMLNKFDSSASAPPPPPCAPIQYSNKVVLVAKGDGSVAQEVFPDMSVEKCGCI